MTLQKEVTGLCINCMHKEHCSYLATVQSPVICCEEYDVLTPDPQRSDVTSLQNNPYETPSAVPGYTNEFQGLCINCENNSSCKTARMPGGVWHCEEYQ
jgi:hypothetical protein